MTTRWREQQLGEMIAQSSRYVAWSRLPFFVPLFMAGQHPSADYFHRAWFDGLLGVYLVWSLARLVWVYRRPVTGVGSAVAALVVDLLIITGLAVTAGGQDSPVRYAYFIWPLATVLWQMPRITAALGAVCMAAYAAMSLPHLLADREEQSWPVIVDEVYVLWIMGVCTLIAMLLGRRTRTVSDLLDTRELLLDDALAAETRERADLADALHDGAVQTLLAALHDLEEVEEAVPGSAAPGGAAALRRAQTEVRRTVTEMREIIFDLHPQILAAAGLAAALEAAGERFARRGGFAVHYDLRLPGRVGHEALLYSAARELLSNVVKHAHASHVWIRLAVDADETVLTVRDDGTGFDPAVVQRRLKEGHIGLASHYVRVESAGGRFTVDSGPGGTTTEVRLPSAAEPGATPTSAP
ncbi:histidine kinase [Streptomyces eurocidicus]|uniref:Histidine kinase n=1 Tax=Streptomyces eurocidicus TaxID=66423 RepID=A0A2N8NQ22_STREU|nr:ATP-binding protein [Streptomyces eurocidicus]MBB5122354.1 two-component system NarL family sensor kinase [Streptomyces eurocidicus]MBF6051638.1 histidine kinase [Streptomyces eurocidicus]PNE30871.1 histidine kinase [Streptomyces eurocidicus]